MLTTIGLLASLGTTGALIGFLFWQAKRAASSNDGELSAVRKSGELELALAARGVAVEARDKTIDVLKAENARLLAAVSEITAQRDQLVASMSPKDSNAAVDAIRAALAPEPLPPAPHRGGK